LSQLYDLWRITSFRRAVGALLDLDEATVSELRQRRAADPGSSPPPGLQVDEAIWKDAVAALGALYDLAAGLGVSSVVTELAELMGLDPQSDSRMKLLLTWLQPTRHDSETQSALRAQASFLPVLTSASATVDFRTTEVANEGDLKLVPVLVVRVNFDEPVSGSEAIVFQVNPAGLNEVIQKLQEALTQADTLTAQLPDGLVVRPAVPGGEQADEA